MASDSLKTCYDAIYTALAGDALWSNRVYFVTVPPYLSYPYVWITMQAGNDMEINARSNPIYMMAIQGVDEDDDENAVACKQRIYELLDDQGELDSGASVSGDATWAIKTISRMEDIFFVEMADRAKRIYRAGNMYEFVMEAK